ncbi:tautomerase family protein [Streptomyces sp. NPDC054933]
MPLWRIYHPANVYSDIDKQCFAAKITEFYTGFGLPEFYVVVLFTGVEESSFYVGGRPAADAVRIVVDHLARHLDDPLLRRRTAERLDAIMAPYTRDRGLHYEFNVTESPRDQWMIGGLFPPDTGSEAEKTWVRESKPLPY